VAERRRLRPFPSVRAKVTAIAVTVVVVALSFGAAVLVAAVRSGGVRSVSGGGPRQAAALAALAGRGALPRTLPPVEGRRRVLVQVVAADGTVQAASSSLEGVAPLAPPGARKRFVRPVLPGVGPGPWLVEPTPATLAAQPASVVVVTSLSDVTRSTHLLAAALVFVVPALAALVGVVVWLVVGRALRPVEQLRQELEAITSRDLHRRLQVVPTDPELERLAQTLNGVLDRVEAANRRERQLVDDASHELRTPLANIRAAVEIASAHPDRADWSLIAADVLEQAARMERLTSDLLTLARSDDGRLPVHTETVDLAGIVSACTERRIPADRELVCEAPAAVLVTVDPDHARRVVGNLVDNALRFAAHTVTVHLATGTRWAELTVTDDGPGVPREQRDRIFERFVRLDEHRARRGGGAGLGLPIARLLVERNGGTIGVRDGGPGATFVVRLPRAGVPALSASS
jgi:signal transduction histidine kinase